MTASVGSSPFANFHDMFGCGTPLALQLMLVDNPSKTVCFFGNTETTGETDQNENVWEITLHEQNVYNGFYLTIY